jgi:Leucine-rich repeat (LRR) protein
LTGRSTDITVFGHLRYLIRVDLSGNKLKDVLNTGEPPFGLQEADLSKNQIMVMSDLSQHRFIQRLCLDGKLLSSVNTAAFLNLALNACRQPHHEDRRLAKLPIFNDALFERKWYQAN